MRVRGFLQANEGGPTTVSELKRVHDLVASETLFGCYAYATYSGAAAFDLNFGAQFWEDVGTRWLFGLDYGRTEPAALRFIAEKPRTEIRIHEGQWVVDSNSFLPRQDFHMKSAFLINQAEERFGMVTGSGNFSANGLTTAVECGSSLVATSQVEYQRALQETYDVAQALWEVAVPLEEVFETYRDRWIARAVPEAVDAEDEPEFEAIETFWIEAGYVTRNRGPDRPGNQIDMPRGMNRYFGFDAPADQPVNSVIGSITFAPANGEPVTRNLRLGNNHMEKISLPIPETHGFDVYDGKVLVFQAQADQFRMWALEMAEFDTAFAGRIAGVKTMASGRRYGYID